MLRKTDPQYQDFLEETASEYGEPVRECVKEMLKDSTSAFLPEVVVQEALERTGHYLADVLSRSGNIRLKG